MQQTWHDLLFAHWPVEPEALRPLVPAGLPLDTYEGKCWVGVVPFRMSGISPRGMPSIPGLSAFPELNVRTYVTLDGKPGVYFFSLDAANPLAVWAARTFFRLPYMHARMECVPMGDAVACRSARLQKPAAEFRAQYQPTGDPLGARAGSLEHWLTERYCLYTANGSRFYRGDIHHRPWPLQPAQADFKVNSMAAATGIVLPESSPHLLFARRLNVLIWPLQRCAARGIFSHSITHHA